MLSLNGLISGTHSFSESLSDKPDCGFLLENNLHPTGRAFAAKLHTVDSDVGER
jgi:hypothetical protein